MKRPMPRHAFAGRHVLLTRALVDAGPWAQRLAERGATPVIMPCVYSESCDDALTRARLVAALGTADWVLFTSVRGVDAVVRSGARLARGTRVGAVGAATANAARGLGVQAPFVPRVGTSAALAEELATLWGSGARGRRVLVVGAEAGRDDLERGLARTGAVVSRVDVYRTLPAPPTPTLRDLSREGISDVLLASPSAVTGLLNQALVSATTRLFTIGPTTSAAVSSAGLVVTGESKTPDLDGLIEAMQCTIRA